MKHGVYQTDVRRASSLNAPAMGRGIKILVSCIHVRPNFFKYNLLRSEKNWYSLCLSCVKWGSTMSYFYELKTGVRQARRCTFPSVIWNIY